MKLTTIDKRLSLTAKGGIATRFFKEFPDSAVLIPVLQKAKREGRHSLSRCGRDQR
jgi:hypothetical protein